MSPGSPTWRLDSDRLAGTRFATVRFFDELGSTNTELVEDARAGAPEGLVMVADHQTAGRGRLGRSWSAEPGTALLVSVLLRPPLPISDVPVVLMAAGLAACDGVEAAAGFRPQLKWPNDLVVGDRKLAGLLTESTPGEVTAVILGLGVNVTAAAYPKELAAHAASCEEEAGRPVDRSELLVAFLVALEARYSHHRPPRAGRTSDGDPGGHGRPRGLERPADRGRRRRRPARRQRRRRTTPPPRLTIKERYGGQSPPGAFRDPDPRPPSAGRRRPATW